MADLPSSAPQMFQLPGANIPMPNNAGAMTQAVLGGAGVYQQQQQIALQQQAQQEAIKQHMVEKHMKMMETGTAMVLDGGPEVTNTGQELIRKSYPFLTGQQLPEGMPIDKDIAKDLSWHMEQHQLFIKSKGAQGETAQDAVNGTIQFMNRYGTKYQQRTMGLLEKQPMYKEAMANQVGGQANGQPATQNEFTGDINDPSGKAMPDAQGSFVNSGQAATLLNEKTQSGQRLFQENTKDAQQVLPDVVDFTHAMSYRVPDKNTDGTAHAMTDQEKANLVSHQRLGLFKYMQVMVPASRRPPNLSSMDNISKEDLVSAHALDAWNQLFKTGAPLLPEMQNALLQNGAEAGLSAEKNLTEREVAAADMAQKNGVDPQKILQNFRPSSIHSTSPYFKNESTLKTPLIGGVHKLTINGKPGLYKLVGTDPNPASGNWVPVKDASGQ